MRYVPLPSVPPGQGSSLAEIPAGSYQQVSIHGTLPRRKKGAGGVGPAHGNYTWDPRANHIMQQNLSGKASLASRHGLQAATSPLVRDTTEDFHGYRYTQESRGNGNIRTSYLPAY